MSFSAARLRADALGIWSAAVDAVRPERLVRKAVESLAAPVRAAIDAAPRILVVGAGKAGAFMGLSLQAGLGQAARKIESWINVPDGTGDCITRLHFHDARPLGSNHPTAAGVRGAEEMLQMLASAGPDDVAFCLLSGGGSALLPAPVQGITLEDKQRATKLLHECGATIHEMNAVRKHLSRVKGGRLAAEFHGRLLVSLIISDVVGDPLDVIASGPTAPDPTTYADALAVIARYDLRSRMPPSVIDMLTRGAAGSLSETVKVLPPSVENIIIGRNADALAAARATAEARGYRVLDLGPYIEGETKQVAVAIAGLVRNIRERNEPIAPPACILIGGETTVTLDPGAGKGGRNQEFVLAAIEKLRSDGMAGVCVLSGGTDGEDGPSDAAGAVATEETVRAADSLGLRASDYLRRHDAYPFFDAAGGLMRTGLTGTNVMDVRVVLVT